MQTTTTHAAPWTPTRRAADWAFRYVIPGRHYSFTYSFDGLMLSLEKQEDLVRKVAALMRARETAP